MGFIEPVTLAASGVPSGGTPSFSVNPVTPPGTSELTISGTGGVAVGSYPITVTGTSSPGSFVHDTAVTLNVYNQLAGAVTLTAPADGATNQLTSPVFSWTAGSQAATYDLQVATDSSFTTVVLDQSGIAATTFTLTTDWRATRCSTGTYAATTRAARARGRSVQPVTMAPPGDCGLVPRQTEFTDDFESGVGSWTHTAAG
jgi:hypothetical protein